MSGRTEGAGVRLEEQTTYSIALQRAIEHHCRGERVPIEVSVKCPHHAAKLNAALASGSEPAGTDGPALDEAYGVVPTGFSAWSSVEFFPQGSDPWYQYVNGNTHDWLGLFDIAPSSTPAPSEPAGEADLFLRFVRRIEDEGLLGILSHEIHDTEHSVGSNPLCVIPLEHAQRLQGFLDSMWAEVHAPAGASSTPAPSEAAAIVDVRRPDAWGVELDTLEHDGREIVAARLHRADAADQAEAFDESWEPKVVPLYRHAPASEPSERLREALQEALVFLGTVGASTPNDHPWVEEARRLANKLTRLSTPTPEPEEASDG